MKRATLRNTLVSLLLAMDLALCPAITLAAPKIPGFYGDTGQLVAPAANALPQAQNIVQGISSLEKIDDNRLIVHQNKSKAIVDWKSFDIGANAWTHFDQKGNISWSALNRIYDRNPSQIFGKLTADGNIYLINQNGILFSQGARVDVHGLGASSLNIADSDFLNSTVHFASENYLDQDNYDPDAAVVANHGRITAASGGEVLLIGPQVENSGTITAPAGRILMAAGKTVSLSQKENFGTVENIVEIDGQGNVNHYASGVLDAEMGEIGLYGKVVNQEGLIRAVTAVQQNGRIVLKAEDTVVTAAGSRIVSTVSTADEAFHESFAFNGGEVDIEAGNLIVHQGEITANSGTVNLTAGERVYLGSESVIDVSGNFVAAGAEEQCVDVTLNSVELRDEYEQKDGVLAGATVTVSTFLGSTIGDISASLSAEEMTALERSSYGGEININVENGDIIVGKGALMDISGGVVTYAEGFINTTKLVSGNQLYGISSAPGELAYDAVVKNIFYGGVNRLNDYVASTTVGGDAGRIQLIANTIVLDGSIDGSVILGGYQNLAAELEDDQGNAATSGREMPEGGTLLIGDGSHPEGKYYLTDAVVEAVTISDAVAPIAADFDPYSDDLDFLRAGMTLIDDDVLNDAQLSNLSIYALTTVTTTANAAIRLQQGGSLTVEGRSVQHYGTIATPGGAVSLKSVSNITTDAVIEGQTTSNPRYVAAEEIGPERVYLAAGSLIDVSGSKFDYTQESASQTQMQSEFLDGGSISLTDETTGGQGVVVHSGATLNVSGGYLIDNSGGVTGGDGGSLAIEAPSIVLNGTLLGHALEDKAGGTIRLHALGIRVVDEESEATIDDVAVDEYIADVAAAMLTLWDERFEETGFSKIILKSHTDLTVADGVRLTPSNVIMAAPGGGHLASGASLSKADTIGTVGSGGYGLVRVSDDRLGATSISLSAGSGFSGDYLGPIDSNQNALVVLAGTASVRTAPTGSIDLSGPGMIIGGTLEAPAGTIALTAKHSNSETGLLIQEGARILAGGYNLPVQADGLEALANTVIPLDGGSVEISAAGTLVLEEGSRIDVSAVPPVRMLMDDGSGRLTAITAGGDPGTISLAYGNDLDEDGQSTLNGLLLGQASREGGFGGTLTIAKTDLRAPLSITSSLADTIEAGGFDDVSLSSLHSLAFPETIRLDLGRRLLLDAPAITSAATDGQGIDVRITAPWAVLANTYYPLAYPEGTGSGTFSLAGEYISVTGDVSIGGFGQVSLAAQRDIILEDRYYPLADAPAAARETAWSGGLYTTADLTLEAARIYPTTLSDFTLHTEGTFATRYSAAAVDTPIHSAGGRLIIEAETIDHQGYLAAPMGEIVMGETVTASENDEGDTVYTVTPAERIFLAQGSVLSTAGQAAVFLGELDEDGVLWSRVDKTSITSSADRSVEAAPDNGIALYGDEIIAMDDSLMDVSGGGSIYTSLFQSGVEGTNDPLATENLYVVLPKTPVLYPGETVYLDGGAGLEAGYYTLLPAEYAFVKGAVVIQDLGSVVDAGVRGITAEGYDTVTGVSAVIGSSLTAQTQHLYSVRSAAAVLEEGNFTVMSYTAGSGGDLTIEGSSTILQGIVNTGALRGYSGGTLSLTGASILIGDSGERLPAGFSLIDAIPEAMRGKLYISTDTFSTEGKIRIGDGLATQTVTLTEGSRIDVADLTISASQQILLESGSSIVTTDSGGDLALLVADGKLQIDDGAALLMGGDLTLDAGEIDFSGTLEMNSGQLTLAGNRLILTGDPTLEAAEGLLILPTLWQHFSEVERVRLTSRTDILFAGDLDIAVRDELTFNTAGISGTDILAGVTISADTIRFQSPDDAVSLGDDLADTGSISMSAGEIRFMGAGLDFDGFSQVNLKSDGDTIFAGRGALGVSGNLDLEAARLTLDYLTAVDDDGALNVTVADYQINALQGVITTSQTTGAFGETTAEGGRLALEALAIDHGGVIQVTAGQVSMTATGDSGSGDIVLRAGSRISNRGSDSAPGGGVDLVAEHGAIQIAAGAQVDVSAGEQGDAGSLSLTSPEASITIAGDIQGLAAGGSGGTFALDVLDLADLTPLIDRLESGGFDETIDIRTRQDGLLVAAEDTLSARNIKLTADGDAITVFGLLDASSEKGAGSVALYAGTDLVLKSGSRILATGIGNDADGGEVILAGDTGTLQFIHGSIIDVGGGSGAAGGSVWFRSRQNATDINMRLTGAISGAEAVYAEAFRVYEGYDTLKNTIPVEGGEAGVLYLQQVKTDAGDFIDDMTWSHALDGVAADRFHMVAGVEVRSDGDISLAEGWDLTSARFGTDGIAGALTLRAGGDLAIEASIIDHPTPSASLLTSAVEADTWQLNLVAGADTDSADLLATGNRRTAQRGDIDIADNTLIYSESGQIRLAAADDLNILGNRSSTYVTNTSMYLSVGTYNQDITVRTGGDIVLSGGIIQSSTGDITVTAGGDLTLTRKNNDTLGSIRTLGTASDSGTSAYWAYYGGGDIAITTGGEIYGIPKDEAWDALQTNVYNAETGQFEPVWYAAYGRDATEGIATMAGGDITISSGADVTAPVGSFRNGDLSVYSGGHLDGRFLVYRGTGTLNAMGSVGCQLDKTKQAIELFDAGMTVSAQGDITIGTILNPLAAYDNTSSSQWYLGYTEQASISLNAVDGSVTLWGNDAYHSQSALYRRQILPATVAITAGQDVNIRNNFYLAPAADGNLTIIAGEDVDGQNGSALSAIYLTDIDPDTIYGYQPGAFASDTAIRSYLRDGHAITPVHTGDTQPVVVQAGNDVKNLMLFSSESIAMTAGHDVRNIYLRGQNVNSGDITTVVAAHDIYFNSLSASENSGGLAQSRGIEVGGPGLLYVQAGNSIDLGTTLGIQAVGSLYNPALQTAENSVIVVAGTGDSLELEELSHFFGELREKGEIYSQRNARGDGSGAAAIVAEIRETLIDPLFEGQTLGIGDIDMIHSQINTQGSAGDIYIVATGQLNVGTSTWKSGSGSGESSNSGIFTTSGGDINIFTEKDLNVNESRVMTFAGGDILAWSNSGNINAGRGARTAVNASESRVEYTYDENGNVASMKVVFDPPAVGSGIRTLTFDPDGVAGPDEAPEAGNVYLFAPSGEIDAGEAGISGKNVILGAVAIVNAQNIEVGGASVGVPDASASTGSLGALAGSGVLSETGSIAESQAGLGGAKERFSKYVADLTEALVPKWLAVEVVGFGESGDTPAADAPRKITGQPATENDSDKRSIID